MHTIRLKKYTYLALMEHAKPRPIFKHVEVGNNEVNVDVDDEVFAELERRQEESGQSFDQILLSICR